MGFGANGGFDFTKELKEILRKKKGFGANGRFGGTKEKRELIVEKTSGYANICESPRISY